MCGSGDQSVHASLYLAVHLLRVRRAREQRLLQRLAAAGPTMQYCDALQSSILSHRAFSWVNNHNSNQHTCPSKAE